MQGDSRSFVSEGALTPGWEFEGDWTMAEDSAPAPYASGSGAVTLPLLAGTSFAVLTGIAGPDMGNYTATLSPARQGAGGDAAVTYSAQNSGQGWGVLWLGALDPGTQHTLRLESDAIGLYTLRQYGDRWVQLCCP